MATATLSGPGGITVEGNGGVLITDYHSVRRIAAGQVTTVAGSAAPGSIDGPAAGALFCHPLGLAHDGSGGVLIADSCNYRVRRLFAGQVLTFAGSTWGTVDGPISTAKLGRPSDLAVDGTGAIYVADEACIRRIANGQVQTFAGECGISWGFADGPASSARFYKWLGIAVDASGALLVADSGNNRIRRVAGGVVTTIAGDGNAGYLDGPGASAQFNNPSDVVAIGPAIYVADRHNHCIRRIQ